MFVTHFDTTSNTIAIEEISHFAYIFCYRAHIKENKKKWRLPWENSASLHQDDTWHIMYN